MHLAGELVKAFEACSLVFKHDVQTTRFLLPYIIHSAVAQGSEGAQASVRAEVRPSSKRAPDGRKHDAAQVYHKADA